MSQALASKKNVVLVGVDGSASSRRAVRVAIDEAMRRDATVHMLYAIRPLYGLTGLDPTQDEEEMSEYRGNLDKYIARMERENPGVKITSEITIEAPAYALVKASHHADLMVLGGRSHNPLAGMVLGSVTNKVLPYSACPVIVSHDREHVANGPVIVGMAPETGSPNAVRFAFEEALLRDNDLKIISGRQHTSVTASLLRSRTRRQRVDDANAYAALRNTKAVEEIAKDYPDVNYEIIIVPDHAADVLVDKSDEASITIVGTQGSLTPSGLIGSVSLAVLREAPLVVVVPENTDED
ncbi:MAG: universal stress protein [Actinomycetaceae bacterium]|nr:universal stress protein [Actinomycetaceae bacterium]